MVTVRVCSKLKTSRKSVLFTNKVGMNSRYFVGVFNETIIPLALVGYDMCILTPLSHCLKLTILEKRVIYHFFLVFHIVYFFACYSKFKIETGNIVILDSILICKAHLIISSCMLICAI